MFSLFSRIERKLDYLYWKVTHMSDNLDRLRTDMAAFTENLNGELTDVQNKLASIASGDSDEDVGKIADQVEALNSQVTTFRSKLTTTDTGGTGADPDPNSGVAGQ